MNQQSTNQRLIAAGVLVAIIVGAVLLVTQVFNEDEEAADEAIDPFGRPVESEAEGEPTEERPDFLYPDEQEELASVTAFTITDNLTEEAVRAEAVDGDEGVFGGDWELLEANEEFDTGLGADSNRINSGVISLPTLRPEAELEDIDEDELEDFGLEEPAYLLTFETDSGNEYELVIGSLNPSGASYYVQDPDETDTIYLIGTTRLNPIIDFIANPPYVQEDVVPDIDPDAVLPEVVE